MLRKPSLSPVVAATALLASLRVVSAQLTTSCNPMNTTCDPDPALSTSHRFHFNSSPPAGLWTTTAGTVSYGEDDGVAAKFSVTKQDESPTLISNFYFFGGKTEVIMKAASGQGIISSIVWSSDDLDEVDWEFLGGDDTNVQLNYFGKGIIGGENMTKGNVTGGTQADYHNYTTTWDEDKLEWWIDGTKVRTLEAKSANDSYNYPQTPMKLSLGIWAAGDERNKPGTIAWAGGKTDYSKCPFSMYVKSAYVHDASTGKEYQYSDHSGSWKSIKVINGTSDAIANLSKEPEKSLSEKWNELPSSARAGVYAGSGCAAALIFGALAFYMIKQRRAGHYEAAAAADNSSDDRVEMAGFPEEKNGGGAAAALTAAAVRKTAADAYKYSDDSRSNSLHSGIAHPEGTSAWDPTSSSGGAPAASNARIPPVMPISVSKAQSRPMSPGEISPRSASLRSQDPGSPPSQPLPKTPQVSGANRSPAPPNLALTSDAARGRNVPPSLKSPASDRAVNPSANSFSAPRSPRNFARPGTPNGQGVPRASPKPDQSR